MAGREICFCFRNTSKLIILIVPDFIFLGTFLIATHDHNDKVSLTNYSSEYVDMRSSVTSLDCYGAQDESGGFIKIKMGKVSKRPCKSKKILVSLLFG